MVIAAATAHAATAANRAATNVTPIQNTTSSTPPAPLGTLGKHTGLLAGQAAPGMPPAGNRGENNVPETVQVTVADVERQMREVNTNANVTVVRCHAVIAISSEAFHSKYHIRLVNTDPNDPTKPDVDKTRKWMNEPVVILNERGELEVWFIDGGIFWANQTRVGILDPRTGLVSRLVDDNPIWIPLARITSEIRSVFRTTSNWDQYFRNNALDLNETAIVDVGVPPLEPIRISKKLDSESRATMIFGSALRSFYRATVGLSVPGFGG